jgi:hypothetical protein
MPRMNQRGTDFQVRSQAGGKEGERIQRCWQHPFSLGSSTISFLDDTLSLKQQQLLQERLRELYFYSPHEFQKLGLYPRNHHIG